MASKVQGVARVARPTRYPWQLVVMVDGVVNKRVRAIARSDGRSIAETLRTLITEALEVRDKAAATRATSRTAA